MVDSNALHLGIDFGSFNIKALLCTAAHEPLRQLCEPSRGNLKTSLLQILDSLLSEFPNTLQLKVAVTGSGQASIKSLEAVLLVNEVLATALGASYLLKGPRTVIDVGGQFSKWILLDYDNRLQVVVTDFASNGLCAAGAGAFLEQQAKRLDLTVESLGTLAAAAPRGARIAGRCSVFAKSDMIHLQQKGTPIDEIALGVCQAMARTFCSTVAHHRKMETPVLLVGGGAANPGLVRAFREISGLGPDQLIVPSDPLFIGAWGAARMAEGAFPIQRDHLFDALQALLKANTSTRGFGVSRLPPLSSCPEEALQPAEDPPPAAGDVAAFLGVDVGSVSTNLALLTPEFKLLQGIYLPTSGRPVEVLNEGLRRIRERFGGRIRILGVASTGSGRHLAAKVLGADVVHNEITAQMASAAFFVPEVDTIFEIGGQDSKYILVNNGTLVDFEMNKICAAGTGSFLEEQAQRLGIHIHDEFSNLALSASHPCDLGARCTVFMESELVKAHEGGVSLEDICAGLAYSVARNYLEKVVASRPIGHCILFQGGTASNKAVVAAFRELLRIPVRVHPFNRISGAIGAALLAARAMPYRTTFYGFQCCSAPEFRSFECRACENRCQVNQVSVAKRILHFGDVCERFSERDLEVRKAPRHFQELFAARNALISSYVGSIQAKNTGRSRLGLVRSSLNLEYLPFWVTFLRELGFDPIVSCQTNATLLQEFAEGIPAEICLPIKASVAQARALLNKEKVEKIFLPGLLECPPRTKDDLSSTCFYTQLLADMLKLEFKDRVVTAQFAMASGILDLLEPGLALAGALGQPLEKMMRALARSKEAYIDFVAARTQLGREALRTPFEKAVVVLGRPYNVHDPFLNLSLARHLERVGLPAIPWDFLPLDEVQLEARWQTVPWHFSREQLRAIKMIQKDIRLFPIVISNYGCGPDGFTMKHLEQMLNGRPRLLLEVDEHQGEAGLVTRLEALADEINQYLKNQRDVNPKGWMTPGPRSLPSGKRFFLPNFSEHARIYAAALRSEGHEAEVLPPPDEETLRLGEQHSSGRECHPYSILAGELIRFVRDTPVTDQDVILIPNCTTSCLLRQYGDALRILLDNQRSQKSPEIWEATTLQLDRLLGLRGVLRLYEGLLTTDILVTLASRLRPYEKCTGITNQRLSELLEDLTRTVSEKESLSGFLVRATTDLMFLPRMGDPGMRPIVGVTGDLYTRMNAIGNAGLFQRLEQMGCEVWSSPFFAGMADLSAELAARRKIERAQVKEAATEGFAAVLLRYSRTKLLSSLPSDIRLLAIEPSARELIQLARPFVGPRTDFLIVQCVAKIADFLGRGAAGVINAAGINCMVGTATASVIPSIRTAFGQAPVITLVCGNSEGPTQRIQLETFVHQVQRRWKSAAA